MSAQQIVERIRSDAQNEAQAILLDAEAKATKLLSDTDMRIALQEKEVRAETEERYNSILDKKAAAARLDSAKLLLKEKRKVIDAIYDEALSRLMELNEEESVALIGKLLEKYAEEGDELFFAKSFQYEESVKILPIIQAKNLKISSEKAEIDGGILLKGEKADKELSFTAILRADREKYQAQLAQELFK